MENEEEEELLKEIKGSVEAHPNRNYLYYYSHKHPLKLYDKNDDVDSKKYENRVFINCSCCSLPININGSKYYWCKKCRHFFHNSCAESPKTILHPFHSHPLSLLQSPLERSCSACKHKIILGSAAAYGCHDCPIFFHDFCLQLPLKLKKHDFHSYHPPLFLNSSVEDDDEQEFKCGGCSKACSGFSYSCRKYLDNTQPKFCISCMFSVQTHEEYHEPAVAHVLTIHSAESLDDSTYICKVCAKEMGELAFFRCDACGFYLHIHCVLQPTFKSLHHRHFLKLTYNHDLGQEEEEELICDLCEKTRHPNLPVYQCPGQGCIIVGHCYCALMEENLSIAHKLGDDNGISIVVIKDPPIILKSALARCPPNMDQVKHFVNKIITDVNEWSIESLSIEFSRFSSHPAFPKFFINLGSLGATSLLDSLELQNSDSLVTVVGEYMILTQLEPVMQLLFANYGDFSKNSFLTNSVEKMFFFNVLCHTMLDICCTEEERISETILWHWIDCFNFVNSVGFDMHFARQRFKKALHSFFGHVSYCDQAMDKLDSHMKMLIQDVVQPISPQFSPVHTSMTSIMINQETSCVRKGEMIKFYEVEPPPFSRKLELDNSWKRYTSECRGEKEPLIRWADTYDIRHYNKDDFRYGFMKKIRDMGFWDYLTLINKMEAFLLNDINHQKNGDSYCGQLLHLVDIPFSICKDCELLMQSGCGMLQNVSCFENRDHKLLFSSTIPSPFGLKVDVRFYYAIDKICCICALPIWGSAYSFDGHGNIQFIHKFCVNFPLEFHHTRLHPEHTLSLGQWKSNSEEEEEAPAKKCNACGNKVCHYGQVYSCESCNFYLEPKCIFQDPITILFPSDDHEEGSDLYRFFFFLVEQNTRSDGERHCDCCQTKLPDSPYLYYYGPCEFILCIRCFLPPKLSYSRHCHELQFNEHYFEDDSGEYYCYACEKPRVQDHAVYHCPECDYVAHIRCAISDICINES